MEEMLKAAKRPRCLTIEEFERLLKSDGPGNTKAFLKRAAGKLDPATAERMQAAIDEAFGRVDE